MRKSTRQKYRVPEGVIRYLMGVPDHECMEGLKEGLAVMRLQALPEVRFADDECDVRLEELVLELVQLEGWRARSILWGV